MDTAACAARAGRGTLLCFVQATITPGVLVAYRPL